jgi:AcrR family transcriptional regulator
MCVTRFLAVFVVKPSARPISAFVLPVASSCSTSNSRGVSNATRPSRSARRPSRSNNCARSEAVDIGFGSFYNHFETKEALFQAAFEETLERWAELIDDACAGMSDPAEVVATSIRITARLCWAQPDIAHFLVGTSLDILDAPYGLAPRARRDIQAGLDSGRFHVPSADIGLRIVGGGLIAVLRLRLHKPDRVDQATVDWFAAAVLRMLGVADAEAVRLAARPLADTLGS